MQGDEDHFKSEISADNKTPNTFGELLSEFIAALPARDQKDRRVAQAIKHRFESVGVSVDPSTINRQKNGGSNPAHWHVVLAYGWVLGLSQPQVDQLLEAGGWSTLLDLYIRRTQGDPEILFEPWRFELEEEQADQFSSTRPENQGSDGRRLMGQLGTRVLLIATLGVIVVSAVFALNSRQNGVDEDSGEGTEDLAGPSTSEPPEQSTTTNPTTTTSELATTTSASVGASYALCRTFDLPGEVHQVEYSPDGAQLAVTNIDNAAWLVHPTTGSILLSLEGHQAGVVGAAFSPDGLQLATAGSDDTARIWDTQTGQQLHEILHQGTDASASPFMFRTAIDPTGSILATTNADGTAQLWDLGSAQHLRTLSAHRRWVVAAAFDPDGRRLVTSDSGGLVIVWDVVTGEAVLRFNQHRSAVFGAVFSPDGQSVATSSTDGTSMIWDPETGDVQHVLDDGVRREKYALTYAFGEDLLAVSGANEVSIWNSRTGDLLQQLPGYGGDVHDLAFSPTNGNLATADARGDLAIYCPDEPTG